MSYRITGLKIGVVSNNLKNSKELEEEETKEIQKKYKKVWHSSSSGLDSSSYRSFKRNVNSTHSTFMALVNSQLICSLFQSTNSKNNKNNKKKLGKKTLIKSV